MVEIRKRLSFPLLFAGALLAGCEHDSAGPGPAKPALLAAIEAKSVKEGGNLMFPVTVLPSVTGAATLAALGLPEGSFFIDGKFIWNPSFLDSGRYVVRFAATVEGVSDTEAVAIEVQNAPVSYSQDVQKVFNGQCIECHHAFGGGGGYEETRGGATPGLDLTDSSSHASLVGVLSFRFATVTPKWRVKSGDVGESYLVQKVDPAQTPKYGKTMPFDGFGGAVSPYDLAAIKAWILEGAPKN